MLDGPGMADIPPDIIGSAAQAGYQQADAARARDASRAEQNHAASRGVKATDDAENTIETSDSDTAVFADSEGLGGQGRSTEEESTETQHGDEDAHEEQEAAANNQDDPDHLDIQA